MKKNIIIISIVVCAFDMYSSGRFQYLSPLQNLHQDRINQIPTSLIVHSKEKLSDSAISSPISSRSNSVESKKEGEDDIFYDAHESFYPPLSPSSSRAISRSNSQEFIPSRSHITSYSRRSSEIVESISFNDLKRQFDNIKSLENDVDYIAKTNTIDVLYKKFKNTKINQITDSGKFGIKKLLEQSVSPLIKYSLDKNESQILLQKFIKERVIPLWKASTHQEIPLRWKSYVAAHN